MFGVGVAVHIQPSLHSGYKLIPLAGIHVALNLLGI